MKLNISKTIFVILIVSIVLSVTAMYYRFYMLRDYEIFYDDYGESESEETNEEESEDTEQTAGDSEIYSENIE